MTTVRPDPEFMSQAGDETVTMGDGECEDKIKRMESDFPVEPAQCGELTSIRFPHTAVVSSMYCNFYMLVSSFWLTESLVVRE
jgi:hypothetical protein